MAKRVGALEISAPFLLSAPLYAATDREVAAWQRTPHAAHFASLGIHDLQLVTRIVYVHLVAGKVIHMADDPHMVLLTADGTLEG